MFIIKASKWDVDKNYNISKDAQPHLYEFRGNTLKEAMFSLKDAKDNNDMTKYTPVYIYDVINTLEV